MIGDNDKDKHITNPTITTTTTAKTTTTANETTTTTTKTKPSPPPTNQPQTPEKMPPLPFPSSTPIKFGPFTIPSSQIFHLSPTRQTYGLINIKPLLPGHILIIPVRPVPRLSQLSVSETTDLFTTVRIVSRTLERIYKADAFNVAVQDGRASGQSVPHVHVHVIPRREGDMDGRGGGDRIYELLDQSGGEGDVGMGMFLRWKNGDGRRDGDEDSKSKKKGFGAVEESQRVVRGEEDMAKEAEWLRREMEVDVDKEGEGEEVEGGKDGGK